MTEKEFVKIWVEKVGNELLKNFPCDFINAAETEIINLPGKLLVYSELLGSYEITDSNGNPFFQTENLNRVKYILYGNRLRPKNIAIPLNDEEISAVVKQYEKLLDSLIQIMNQDFVKTFPESKNFHAVSNQVFGNLNLQRY